MAKFYTQFIGKGVNFYLNEHIQMFTGVIESLVLTYLMINAHGKFRKITN